MRLAHCILAVLLGAGIAAAWDCPGGVKGSDEITGYSSFYGLKDAKDSVTYIDQVVAWKKFGPITKINLYYSYNYGCIQGFKVTYGYDARNAQLIGVEKGLTSVDLSLAPYEGVSTVEIKEGTCVQWIKLTTNKGHSVSLGKSESNAPIQVSLAEPNGFLAAVRGYENLHKGQPVTKGALGQLQFVWAVGLCPNYKPPAEPTTSTTPPTGGDGAGTGSPDSGAGTGGEPGGVTEPAQGAGEGPGTTDGEPAPDAAAEPSGEGVDAAPGPGGEAQCPPNPDACDVKATTGNNFCPAVAPFTYNQCIGSCCISSGKCKRPFCEQNGLGQEVLATDTICWGTNTGIVHKFNRCRNLACKLAVPGCVTDIISGACVGSVVPLSNEIDDTMAKWVGAPCLQTLPGGLPINAQGKPDVIGPFAAKLWSVCNCAATSSLAHFNKGKCQGPLCSLFQRPDLPSLNFAMPNISLADIGPLVDINSWNFSQVGVLFAPPSFNMPRVTVQIPDISAFADEWRQWINDTTRLLNPAALKVLKPRIPNFSVDVSGAEIPQLVVNLPASNVQAEDLIPIIDASQLPTDVNGLPTFNVSHLGLPNVQNIVKAFSVHSQLQNMGVPTDPAVINQAIDYIHGQVSEQHKKTAAP